ncbi:MAG: tRNA (N6-isopentenyl adenosine(37)-C2)-methylthiotransferase MiaB [Candidatus Omnitrophica bacterium]|nr:tRNA (N6-isopentenyl adenosine(37)-C2)-methylthiotransferase MiaB [Candidatus Omnitrophota bacterium]MDD5553710.1 tRNA (N6-isopentenyl adenosine(37)-C2)-methylthiotransferase MiaB [Candidatus Omnitrophota bacterium]
MINNEIKKNKVFLMTFGCQMNVRDSEVIAGILGKSGYRITDKEDKADVVILNTCSVRQHAEDKVWSAAGRYSKLKVKPLMGIAGCMAQNYKEKIFERSPGVDFVVGPGDIAKIPEIIKSLTETRIGTVPKERGQSLFLRKIWETDAKNRPDEIYHTGFYEDKDHAYVVISEGCSNFCSYCVVPYVRGGLRHRDHKDVLNEIEDAARKGITRITLLGQNVNAYRDFVGLLTLVNGVKGIKEFSFITSHPKDTSVELFKAMAELEKLKKYLHLPAQSGSDRILKLMNRGYTRKFYLDLADKYRKMVRNAVLTADIIVGFPSETENDFMDTYNLVKEAEFDAAYIFKYSPRPNTEAAKLPDDVEKKEKERRHRLILDLQKEISKNKKR